MAKYPHCLIEIATGWQCLTCQKTWKQRPRGACSLLQRGAHLVMRLNRFQERCVRCERLYDGQAWGDCAGVRQYDWDHWPEGFFTEKQLREMKTEVAPWGYQVGEIRGAVYYSKAPDHFLKLYRLDEAIPKPEPSARRQANMQRQAEAMHRAWHCQRCDNKTGRYQKDGGFCDRCQIVLWAERLLHDSFVVFDCETTGFSRDDEILQVGLIDSTGEVRYKSYIKPVNPIIEAYGDQDGEWQWGDKPHFTSFEISGISNAMVASSPGFSGVWAQLAPLMEGRTVVSYNVAFDQMILETLCHRHHETLNDSLWECAMEAYAQFAGDKMWGGRHHGKYRWHSLDRACTAMDCHGGQPHDAVGDCQRTLALIKAMAAAKIPVETPPEIETEQTEGYS